MKMLVIGDAYYYNDDEDDADDANKANF